MTRLSAVTGAGLVALACGASTNSLPTAPTRVLLSSATIGGGPDVTSGVSISEGDAVRSAVEFPDPRCFRNWDAGGRCRQFDIVAPQDGVLTVRVSWEGRRGGVPDNVDLFVVEPRGGWYVSSDGDPEKSVNVAVTAGSTYHIVVMAYALFPQDFELRAALRGR